MRGGVPVLKRPMISPRARSASEMPSAGASPLRPPACVLSPITSRPLMKVPVVRMTVRAAMVQPRDVTTPVTRNCPSPSRSDSSRSTVSCFRSRLGCVSSAYFIASRYACLSHCARSAWTAGPFPVLSRRIWMKVRSVFFPISPPSASISRTRCPFAGPPMEGLQGMRAMLSRFIVSSSVRRPIRADARAASQPACPAPTTSTS